MLFKTIHFKQFMRAKKSSLIIPWFCAILAFFVDIWMICDSGTRPGQQFFSFLITWFRTSLASFSGIWSHLLHTNMAHWGVKPPCPSSVTFLTSSSSFSSWKSKAICHHLSWHPHFDPKNPRGLLNSCFDVKVPLGIFKPSQSLGKENLFEVWFLAYQYL